MVFGMAYVSPRRVLQHSSAWVRWQLWGLVSVGVAGLSVTVYARGEASVQPEWVTYWPVFTSLILFVFNLGITWQQLSETKRRIERLESQAASKDVIAEKFDAIAAEIKHVRELMERSR